MIWITCYHALMNWNCAWHTYHTACDYLSCFSLFSLHICSYICTIAIYNYTSAKMWLNAICIGKDRRRFYSVGAWYNALIRHPISKKHWICYHTLIGSYSYGVFHFKETWKVLTLSGLLIDVINACTEMDIGNTIHHWHSAL